MKLFLYLVLKSSLPFILVCGALYHCHWVKTYDESRYHFAEPETILWIGEFMMLSIFRLLF